MATEMMSFEQRQGFLSTAIALSCGRPFTSTETRYEYNAEMLMELDLEDYRELRITP